MSILNEVIKDLIGREEKGIMEYGSPLKTSSSNDAIQFAYEEALDLVMYLKQEIKRRGEWTASIKVHTVHNHGSEEGPGLACPEYQLADGRKLGACLLLHKCSNTL